MQEVVVDLSTFFTPRAKLSDISLYKQKAIDLAGNGNAVFLTGVAPVWFFLAIAHALYEKAWKLMYRGHKTGDMEIFTHSPIFYDYKKGKEMEQEETMPCKEVVLDLSTFYYAGARYSDLRSKIHSAVELASENYDNKVVLTGAVPTWFYLQVAHALEEEVKSLVYRAPVTGDVVIFGHSPLLKGSFCREFIVNLAPEGTAAY